MRKGFQMLDARFGLREKIPSYEGWMEDPDYRKRISKTGCWRENPDYGKRFLSLDALC